MEECDSRDQSEDDSSPTDTSEDSVEVKVNRIYFPGINHSQTITTPNELRKVHSSSSKRFEALDFSVRQLKSVSSQCTVNSTSSDVVEKLSLILTGNPPDNNDRKYSRRKSGDPRRLLINKDKLVKRCSITDDPPHKFLRQDETDNSKATRPSTSFDRNSRQMASELTTFQPIFFSALHSMIRFPYSNTVNNVIVPHLSFLQQGMQHAPYSTSPRLSPNHNPHTDIKCYPNSASPIVEQVNQNIKSKICDNISKMTYSNISTEKSEMNMEERCHFIGSRDAHSPFISDVHTKEYQEMPIDYSIKKVPLSRHRQTGSSNRDVSRREILMTDIDLQGVKHKQRNYKNMTRERRVEANARERTRVHTISAAFEKLRQSIPSSYNNQKLSKLSVLRIACTYILSLSRLAGLDSSLNETSPAFAECVELITETIQTESKIKQSSDE